MRTNNRFNALAILSEESAEGSVLEESPGNRSASKTSPFTSAKKNDKSSSEAPRNRCNSNLDKPEIKGKTEDKNEVPHNGPSTDVKQKVAAKVEDWKVDLAELGIQVSKKTKKKSKAKGKKETGSGKEKSEESLKKFELGEENVNDSDNDATTGSAAQEIQPAVVGVEVVKELPVYSVLSTAKKSKAEIAPDNPKSISPSLTFNDERDVHTSSEDTPESLKSVSSSLAVNGGRGVRNASSELERVFYPGDDITPTNIVEYNPSTGFSKLMKSSYYPTSRVILLDGVCVTDSEDNLTKAAFGIYFGRNSPHNYSSPLPLGVKKSQPSADLYAVKQALEFMFKHALADIPRPTIGLHLILITSSEYVVHALTDFLEKWKSNGFRASENQVVNNLELILTVDRYIEEMKRLGVAVKLWQVSKEENASTIALAEKGLEELPESHRHKHEQLWERVWDRASFATKGEIERVDKDEFLVRRVLERLEYPINAKENVWIASVAHFLIESWFHGAGLVAPKSETKKQMREWFGGGFQSVLNGMWDELVVENIEIRDRLASDSLELEPLEELKMVEYLERRIECTLVKLRKFVDGGRTLPGVIMKNWEELEEDGYGSYDSE